MNRIARLLAVAVVFCAAAQAQWISGFYGGQNGVLPISEIPWHKYTHIIHFAAAPGVNSSGAGNGTISLHWLTSSEVSAITAARPAGKKVIVCIKDNDFYPNAYAQSTASGMIATFVQSIVNFVNQGYDGVDLDWEANINATQYNDLIRRLRAAMPNKVITMDGGNWGGLQGIANTSQSYLDQINLMCYDMDGGSSTWFNSALLTPGSYKGDTCDVARMNPFVSAGVAKHKLGIGLPYYERRWVGTTQPGVSGSFSKYTILYRQLVTDTTRWRAEYQKYSIENKANYLSIPALNEFISYVGTEQLQDAVNWMKSQGFGGLMTFSTQDEYVASRTGDARFPLSTALWSMIFGTSTPAPNVPTASITAPAPGMIVSGTILVSANASDSSGVSRVELYVDGTRVSTDTTAPYTFPWDTRAVADGSHTLVAKAFNAAGTVGTSTAVAVTVDNSSGPYAYWKLDETSGSTAADSSGQGNTMTLVNGPVRTSSNCVTAACVSFNGASQYGYAGLDLSQASAVTVAFWMNWSAYADDDHLAVEFTPNFNDRNAGLLVNPNSSNGGGQFEAGVRGDGGYNQVLFARPSAGVWHHYAFVLNKAADAGLEITPYVDGVAVPYTKPNNSENLNAFGKDNLFLASRNGSALFGPGTLDEVRVYRRALDASEVQALSIRNTPSGTAPAIMTSSLPDGVVGQAYSHVVTATGTTPIQWSIASGSLPRGLSLNSGTGEISGTPEDSGTSTFTIRATNSAGNANVTLTLAIHPPPTPSTVRITGRVVLQ